MTVNMTQGGTTGAISESNLPNSVAFNVTVRAVDVAAKKGSALAAAEVIQVMNIPVSTIVSNVFAIVRTATTSTTMTINVGDGTNPDRWVDGADGKTLGIAVQGTNGVSNEATGYIVAETLDLVLATLTGGVDDWEIDICATFTEMNAQIRPRAAKDNPDT